MKGNELAELKELPLSMENIPQIKRRLRDIFRPDLMEELHKEKALEMVRFVYDLRIKMAQVCATQIIRAREKEALEEFYRSCQELIVKIAKTYTHYNNELCKLAAVSNKDGGKFAGRAQYCLNALSEDALEQISGKVLPPANSQEVEVEYDPVEEVFQNRFTG
jgi:hypothetical protein